MQTERPEGARGQGGPGRRLAVTAGITVGALGLIALAGPFLGGTDPFATALGERLRPPGPGHPFGQDALGRDVLARVLYGARISLGVGAAAVALSLGLGVACGAIAGWAGGWLDEAIGRVIDVVLAFPGLLFAIALAAVLGPSVPNVILALGLFGWTGYARLTRAQIGALRRREFVVAAQALGAAAPRIVLRHLLPLAAPVLAVQAAFGMAGAIVAEASLSFLGVGAPPPLPSWGAMIDEGRPFLLVAPHVTLFPGLALATTVVVLQLLGDRLRDALDVRLDERPFGSVRG